MKSHTRCRATVVFVFILAIIAVSQVIVVHSLSIAVYGGSGFLGRRICKTLVGEGHDVISISRSGKPPACYTCCNDNGGDGNGNGDWAEKVDWKSHCIVPVDVGASSGQDENTNAGIDFDDLELELPPIDAAISCIGNINPAKDWDKLTFFGLAYDDDLLYQQNGLVNECAAKIAKRAGANRFVFMSVSYEVAKMMEGPVDGYMRGKRHAEHVICNVFGKNNAIVLGPSLIYGGNRLPTLGKLYSQNVNNAVAKAYLNSMDALRNLSSTPVEDWVEKSLFSPPVEVHTVARVAAAASLGLIAVDMVDPRKQNFFDFDGQPVTYDDVVYIDGTKEIERLEQLLDLKSIYTTGELISSGGSGGGQQLWEGALVGKKPYLYPFPVIAVFLAMFGAISTNQFVVVS